MASASLVPVAREETKTLGPPYKMYIVTRGISPPPPNIIWHTNAEKFRYDDDLAIPVIFFAFICDWG